MEDVKMQEALLKVIASASNPSRVTERSSFQGSFEAACFETDFKADGSYRLIMASVDMAETLKGIYGQSETLRFGGLNFLVIGCHILENKIVVIDTETCLPAACFSIEVTG